MPITRQVHGSLNTRWLVAAMLVLALAGEAWALAGSAESRPVQPGGVEDRQVGSSGSDAWGWVRTIFALAIVVALVFVLRWGLRRYGGMLGVTATRGPVEVLVRTALSSRHQVYLVRMGGRLLLLGGGNENLSTLAEVTDPAEQESLIKAVEAGRVRLPAGMAKSLLTKMQDEAKRRPVRTGESDAAGEDK